jgi:cell division protein FtsW
MQIVGLVVGLIGLLAAVWIPLRWWRRMSSFLFAGTVLLLLAVLVGGVTAGGATRWLAVGPVQVQPSEIAKLTTILFLATLVSRKETSMHRLRDFFWPIAVSVGFVSALVLFQPDLGTTLLICAGAYAVLFASAAPFVWVGGSAVLGSLAAFVAAVSSPYRWARVTSFLDLAADPLGGGYQATQSLVALGTGGVFGVGLGASRARWSFLPNAHTDFVFSIIGEETGLAGSLTVILLFVWLAVAGMVVAHRSADRFGRLVAVGLTTWLAVQGVVNLGGVTGVLPITGVPLPFVSYGGSALVVSLVAVGILIRVAREMPVETPEAS